MSWNTPTTQRGNSWKEVRAIPRKHPGLFLERKFLQSIGDAAGRHGANLEGEQHVRVAADLKRGSWRLRKAWYSHGPESTGGEGQGISPPHLQNGPAQYWIAGMSPQSLRLTHEGTQAHIKSAHTGPNPHASDLFLETSNDG